MAEKASGASPKKTITDRFGRTKTRDQVAKAISSTQGLDYSQVLAVMEVFDEVQRSMGVPFEELLPALIRRLDPGKFDIHMAELRLTQTLYGPNVHTYICVNPHTGVVKRGLCYPSRADRVPDSFPGRQGWKVKQDPEIDEWMAEYGRARVERWCVFLL